MFVRACVRVCVCVRVSACVRERESARASEREKERGAGGRKVGREREREG